MERDKFVIELFMSNAAFDGNRYEKNAEVARILQAYAQLLLHGCNIDLCRPLHDINGNVVGYADTESNAYGKAF